MAIHAIAEAQPNIKEIIAVYNGQQTKVSKEEKEAHLRVYEHFKSQGKAGANNPTFRKVAEQGTADGRALRVFEATDFAHFLAWNNRKDPEIQKLIGNVKLTPCLVNNPQTAILAKPESVAAQEQGKGRVAQLRSKLKSKGTRLVMGVMGKSVFEGTVQAFGEALSFDNMNKDAKTGAEIRAELEAKGFNMEGIEFGENANYWDLPEIVRGSLKKHAAIEPHEIASDPIPSAPIKDKDGNGFYPYVTPVNKTVKEIIQGKEVSDQQGRKSKFKELISLPTDPRLAKLVMAGKNLNFKAYVPDLLERVNNLVKSQTKSLTDKVLESDQLHNAAKKAGKTRADSRAKLAEIKESTQQKLFAGKEKVGATFSGIKGKLGRGRTSQEAEREQ